MKVEKSLLTLLKFNMIQGHTVKTKCTKTDILTKMRKILKSESTR